MAAKKTAKRRAAPTKSPAATRTERLKIGGHAEVPPALSAFAEQPTVALALALYDRITHPDFTTQLPDAAAKKKKYLAELSRIAASHPEIKAALQALKAKARGAKAAEKASLDSGVMARIAHLRLLAADREPYVRGPQPKRRAKWTNELRKLRVELFGKWNPYPMRAFAELSPEQQALERLEYDEGSDDWRPEAKALAARRIGLTAPGPADVVIALEQPRALYCAVNDVAAGLRGPGPVIAQFTRIEDGVAAWGELAQGIYGVDVDRAQEWRFAGAGTMRAFNVEFRERFVSLLGAFSLTLGAAGEAAARELATQQARATLVTRAAMVALYALSQHASERGEVLDPCWDPLLRRAFEMGGPLDNPIIEQRLIDHLPAARAAPLEPLKRVFG